MPLVPDDEPQGPGPINRFLTAVDPVNMAKTAYNDPAGALQSTDDAVRAAANAATFGMADRFAGLMSGTGTDPQVQLSEQARQRSPNASIVGDVAGAAALPGFGAEALATRMGGGLLARGAAYGGTGALTGAAQGAGTTYTGNPEDYVKNALIGGGLGGALGGAGGAVFGRAQVPLAKTPTIPELQAFKNAAYEVQKANPTRYDAAQLAQRANQLEQQFWNVNNYQREFSPASFNALDQMRRPAATSAAVDAGDQLARATVSPANIEFIRRGVVQNATGKTDRESSRLIKQALDEFVDNPPPGAVLPGYEGSARDAATAGVRARTSNAAYERANIADALRRQAESEAISRNSGLNIEAKLRAKYGDFTKPSKRGVSEAVKAGFSPETIGRMEAFAAGVDTRGRNALRYLGNFAGGGGGMGALTANIAGGLVGAGGAGTAYATDDPRWLYGGIGLPLAGLALRKAGNRVALSSVNRLNEAIRQDSPLYRARQLAHPGMRSPDYAVTRATGVTPSGAAQAMRDQIALQLLKQRQAEE